MQCTALHLACRGGRGDTITMVEVLLANCADVNMSEQGQITALYHCTSHGYLDCAKALIAAGADLNHADSSGTTCLHVVITHYPSSVVQLLLEHGATAVINSVIPKQCP
jgi:uncharacterized protein